MSDPSQTKAREQITDSLLLVAVVVIIYARTLGHEFQMSWDDNWYVVYNESIPVFSWQNVRTIFSSIYQANYAPLQMLSYMLDYSLWGLKPGGFLATNFILHALNGLLLYRLLYGLHGERLLALIASGFFLVHPLQVESVAWISCRKNVLSLLFFLLSWEAYRRYRGAEPGRGRGAYLASLAAFVLSLMAKSTTLVLPLILLLYDICFPLREQRLRLKDKIPYLIAALVFALISMRVQQTDFQGGIRMPYHGGNPLATFFTMLPVFCLYLWRLAWPAGLSAVYAPPIHKEPDVVVIAAGLILTLIAWGGIRLFRADRRLGFWFLFFWIGLIPFAQIVPIQWLITDRYINVSIIGAAALAAAAIVYLRNRLRAGAVRILLVFVAIWLLALSVVSFQRVGVWRDSLSLWEDAVAKTPGSAYAWEHLGETYRFRGKPEAARQAYERGLELNPSNTEILSGLGDLYTDLGELEKGYALLEKLLRIKPYYAMGWGGLGNNYLRQGNYDEAEKAYKRALEIQPDAMQVVTLLGNLALIRGRLDEARNYYSQVEAKGWNDPEVAYRMACVESQAGRLDDALAWVETALRRGYRDYSALYSNAELSALRGDPRFNYLLRLYIPEHGGERR